ncbi:MAG TPA: AraC family transcriptional regulator [Ktedonobacterales bacterium]|nr:AraC family transcriptional regulator [Ktedonobacterales bacterium]
MPQATPQQSGERAFRPATLTAYGQTVERVIQSMRAQLAEPLSLEEMAEIAYLSPFHFNRVFRSITDIPPGEFLASLRLEAAKRLLLTTTLSVTDVCFELGYTSLGTFTTRFKQLVGLSPLQLRQMADVLASAPIQPLLVAHSEMRRLGASHTRGVRGSITAPDSFSGLIFVGLFPKFIAPNGPVACTTIPAPGAFQISPAPDGRYHLLAAALPWSRNALTYLLPERGILVGVSERPVVVNGGQASAPVELVLRPPCLTDPPILGVFPPLRAMPAASRIRAAL